MYYYKNSIGCENVTGVVQGHKKSVLTKNEIMRVGTKIDFMIKIAALVRYILIHLFLCFGLKQLSL